MTREANACSVLSPLYALFTVSEFGGELVYYGEGEPHFLAVNPRRATLFANLHQAARVAVAEKMLVRVITSDDELKEFQ